MKRLVPALLALLAGCGEPTIPEQLGIEVGQQITVVYPAHNGDTGRPLRAIGRVTQISGDWVRVKSWFNLRIAVGIEQK